MARVRDFFIGGGNVICGFSALGKARKGGFEFLGMSAGGGHG